MKKIIPFVAILSLVLMTGCQRFGVYTIDIPQGTPIVQSVAKKVQIGMNTSQVLYILGSPALKDTLAQNRWDYIYNYTAGTDGRRAGKADIKNSSQYLSIYFDSTGRVTRIDGIDTLPKR